MLGKPFDERGGPLALCCSGVRSEETNDGYLLGLLRPRAHRPPSRRTAQNAEKFPPSHVRSRPRRRHRSGSIRDTGRARDVRFGSKADMAGLLGDVRFAPESGH